jgi:hypothetical protein
MPVRFGNAASRLAGAPGDGVEDDASG